LLGRRVRRGEPLVVRDRLSIVMEVELDLAERELEIGDRVERVRGEQLLARVDEVAGCVELADLLEVGGEVGRLRRAIIRACGHGPREHDSQPERPDHGDFVVPEPLSVGSSIDGFHSTFAGRAADPVAEPLADPLTGGCTSEIGALTAAFDPAAGGLVRW